MNMLPIVKLLEDADLGVQAQSIFVGEMPVECKQGILLLDNYYGTMIHPYLKGYRSTEFRLITRSLDYVIGEKLAFDASDTLDIGDARVQGTVITQCRPLNEPRFYRRGVSGLLEFEVDFDIRFVNP